MVAIQDTAKVALQCTTECSYLCLNEPICIFNEPIAFGLPTQGVLQDGFVTSPGLDSVLYSHHGGFIISFEKDIRKASDIDVMDDLLYDELICTLFRDDMGEYRLLRVVFDV